MAGKLERDTVKNLVIVADVNMVEMFSCVIKLRQIIKNCCIIFSIKYIEYNI